MVMNDITDGLWYMVIGIYMVYGIALQSRIPGYKSFTSEQRVALVRGELFKVYRLHHAIRYASQIAILINYHA